MSDSLALNDLGGGTMPSAIDWKETGKGTVVRGKITQIGDQFTNKFGNDSRGFVLETDAGLRTLYVQPGTNLSGNFATAVTEAGEQAIRVGAELAVAWVDDEPTDKGNPKRIFKVKYTAPVSAGISVDDVF